MTTMQHKPAAALTGIYRTVWTTCSWIRTVTGETSQQQILTSYSRRSSSPLVFLRHFLVEGLSLSFVPPAETRSSVNKLDMQVMLKRNSVQTESTRQAAFYKSFGNCLVKLPTGENKLHRVEEQLHLLGPGPRSNTAQRGCLKEGCCHGAAVTSVSKPTARKSVLFFPPIFVSCTTLTLSVCILIMQSAQATLQITARFHKELQRSLLWRAKVLCIAYIAVTQWLCPCGSATTLAIRITAQWSTSCCERLQCTKPNDIFPFTECKYLMTLLVKSHVDLLRCLDCFISTLTMKLCFKK